MSVVSHIVHLQAKHSELENTLAQEMARPMPNFYIIRDMKKQKLLIKEEIARLTRDEALHHQDAAS